MPTIHRVSFILTCSIFDCVDSGDKTLPNFQFGHHSRALHELNPPAHNYSRGLLYAYNESPLCVANLAFFLEFGQLREFPDMLVILPTV